MADEKTQKTIKVGDVLAKDKSPKAPAEKTDKPEKKAAEPKKARAKHKHTHVEHHYDADGKSTGHTVRHTPMGGGEEVSYAAHDLDAVHDGLEQHVGEPNEGEEAEAAPTPQPQPTPAQPGA